MANLSGLNAWILHNAKKLNLAVTCVTWVDEWLPGYFDYRLSITLDGQSYEGRGVAEVDSLAFEKAASEALERYAVHHISEPWGVAAFPDFDGAAQRAYQELVGIDRALCHHFCKIRFMPLSLDVVKTCLPLDNVRMALKKYGLQLHLFELRPVQDAKIVLALASSNHAACDIKGFVKGVGCNTSLKYAARHAMMECLRSAVAIFIGNASPKDDTEMTPSPTNPRWHFWTALTKTSMDYLAQNLLPKPGENIVLDPENISIQDVQFERVTTPDAGFSDMPLVIVQARSDKLIRPQFGPFRSNEAMLRRLACFSGGQIVVDISVPHFYG